MNTMEIRESKLLGDRYWRVKHPSGLTIFVYPKAQMRSTYALFGLYTGSAVAYRQDDGRVTVTDEPVTNSIEQSAKE